LVKGEDDLQAGATSIGGHKMWNKKSKGQQTKSLPTGTELADSGEGKKIHCKEKARRHHTAISCKGSQQEGVDNI